MSVVMDRKPKWDYGLPEAERAPEEAWEAVPETHYRIQEGDKCRYGSPRYGYCGRPSVLAIKRGEQNRWWAYCELHTYNRWVEDGQVLTWHLKPEYRARIAWLPASLRRRWTSQPLG